MTTTTERALKAIKDFGRQHSKYREAEDEIELSMRQLHSEWLTACTDQVFPELDEDSWDEDLQDDAYDIAEEEVTKINEALRAYLESGGSGSLQLGDEDSYEQLDVVLPLHDRERELASLRQDFLDRLARLTQQREDVRKDLQAPHENVVASLRQWLQAVRDDHDPAADLARDWPSIVSAWQHAVDATTRELAGYLDVSASTVVRYLRADRTPSVHYAAAMIERIAQDPGTRADSPMREAARNVAILWGEPARTTEIMEGFERPEAETREQVQTRVEHLNLKRLRILDALLLNPETLDALENWVQRDPLQPVKDALVANRNGQSGKESTEGVDNA
jgi:transcriptional regulator with XRE-family HTH domain